MKDALRDRASHLLRNVPLGPDRLARFALEAKPFTPEVVLEGYHAGFFPLPDDAGAIRWYDPEPRGVIPIGGHHVETLVGKLIRKRRFRVTVDSAFERVIAACAEGRTRKEASWLTPEIVEVYTALHHLGAAHSVETWEGDQLVGGCYGLALGRSFTGESQFYWVSNAGKVAMAYLCRILEVKGFLLHDAQMIGPYMRRFGGLAMPRAEFHALHRRAQIGHASFEWVEFEADR